MKISRWISVALVVLPATAPLGQAETFSGFLSESLERDVYTYHHPGDGQVKLTFRHNSFLDEDHSYWMVLLKAENSSEIIRQLDVKRNELESSFLEGLSAGNYWIEVRDNLFYISDPYEIEVTRTPATTELWPNETREEANAIEFGTEYEGNLAMPLDRDHFSFHVGSVGELRINLSHETIIETQGDSTYWVGSIYPADEVTELQRVSIKGNELAASAWVGLAPGDYVLVMRQGGARNLQRYGVRLDFEADGSVEIEPNGTREEATEIVSGRAYRGNVFSDTDKDYYVVDIPQSGDAIVRLEQDTVAEDARQWFRLQVVPIEQTSSIATLILTGEELGVEQPVALDAGRYLVVVSRVSVWVRSDYRFSIQAGGARVPGVISSDIEDAVMVSWNSEKGAQYRIEFSEGGEVWEDAGVVLNGSGGLMRYFFVRERAAVMYRVVEFD